MFFDDEKEILPIASKCNTAVFVVPDSVEVEIKNSIVLKPEEKSIITIDQARELIRRLGIRQTSEQYIIIRPADKMGDDAANALLKNLEEPGDKVHFVLVTNNPSKLLPTILSRSRIYFLRNEFKLNGKLEADDKTKELAKKLLVAKPDELIGLAETIIKKKDGVREYALDVIGVVVEMLYKMYLMNPKDAYLQKLRKFLVVYEAINRKGHIKLQLVSNLC